jgi:hypothetical protein
MRTRTRTRTSNINKLTSDKKRVKDSDVNKMIPKINCWLLDLKSNQGKQKKEREGVRLANAALATTESARWPAQREFKTHLPDRCL